MDSLNVLAPNYTVGIVSCDIVGHSSATAQNQLSRVAAINEIVARTIESGPAGKVVWASGGDGGHVLFLQEYWQQPAVDLILTLRQWTYSEGVLLRIIGHYGVVAPVQGADGRVQMVGEAINYAARLLTQATHKKGVVVSEVFRREIVSTTVEPAIEFHEPRSIHLLHFRSQLLHLMSTQSARSEWGGAPQGDRAGLEVAVRDHAGWDVLYFVKRIWQVNSADRDIIRALEGVKHHHLRYHDVNSASDDVNPMLGQLHPDELQEVVRLGQLIERRRGEFICRYDEAGDTMWVILRGQVGVYNSEGEGFDGAADPKHVHRQGEIVGELAFALSRNRTADLVALTDVALLSFNYDDVQSRLVSTKVGEAAARQVSAFINYRVLQHVSDNAPYLLGPRRTGPLAMGSRSWEYALTILRKHCELLAVDTRALELTLNGLVAPTARGRGLYILVSGVVRANESDGTLLKGSDFPVLWIDVPNLLPSQLKTYWVEDEPIKVLRVAAEGIDELQARQREELRRALPRALNGLPDKYEFDVFLCHSKRDWQIVSLIRQRLANARIKCWVADEHIHPGLSVSESIERGLRSSRYLLACVSANFAESGWAERELRSALHVDLDRRKGKSVLVLMLNERDDKDEVIPLLVRDARRISYTREGEFEELVRFLSSSV